MKISIFISLLSVFILIAGCDNSTDSMNSDSDDLSGLWRSDLSSSSQRFEIFLDFTASEDGYTLIGYEYYGECYVKSPTAKLVSIGINQYRIEGGGQDGEEGSFTLEDDILTVSIENQSSLTYTISDRSMSPVCED